MKKKNIIFLDIDGVLNSKIYYETLNKERTTRHDDICPERLKWLNKLCLETDSLVVITSTWRIGKSIEELRKIFFDCGSTFYILDKTKVTGYERGTEISLWLEENRHIKFKNYVIIDDDSDMLLEQQQHFFQTDNYVGLTPNVCYRIKRFLMGN